MIDRLRNLWEGLHTSFWFVPCLMALGAALLSLATIWSDQHIGPSLIKSVGFIWSGGAQGARSLLSTIAGSMITVSGVVFSITIVALTLASSQFGPRLLRNFVRDTGNQVTLGIFIATFLYCILVLRTIRGQNEGSFVPYISITGGVVLTIASLGVLIYFIHHVSLSIQAENVVAVVSRELNEAIDKHFPEKAAETSPQARTEFARQLLDMVSAPVLALKGGYLLHVERDELVEKARQAEARVVLNKQPGDFIAEGEEMAGVWLPPGRQLAESALKDAHASFQLGKVRTAADDVRHPAQQLAEIGSRALSPGINDPFTAMECLDWIGDALGRIAGRCPAAILRADSKGTARLMEAPTSFAEMCQLMLEWVIAYGMGNTLVTRHTLASLGKAAHAVRSPANGEVLRRYVARVVVQARVLLKDAEALAEVMESGERLQERLASQK